MPTSAKRLGLDVGDIELESRLRRIEILLASKVDATSLSEDGSTDTQRVDNVPQVIGLKVSGSTPGAITVAWNQVRISDLRRYELDVAEDLAFVTNAETKNIAGTEFTYNTNTDTGGGGDTTIFIRVRARASSGNVGPYSVTLNTTTGQAQSADIADDAIDANAIQDGAVTSDKVDSNDPITFVGLNDADVGAKLALTGYITPRGFHMSNATIDTIRDAITVTAGVVRGEANNGSINLGSDTTKDITNKFAPGTGNGGFPTTALTLTDGVDYRVFAIDKIDGSQADVGYDTSVAAANLIAEAVLADSGYAGALYRQLGWITYTSAAAGIRPFFSPAREPEVVIYEDNIVEVVIDTSITTAQLFTLDVPPDVTAHYNLKWELNDSTDQTNKFVWFRATSMSNTEQASISNFTHMVKRETETDMLQMWRVKTEVDASSQIRARFDTTSAGTRAVYSTGFRFIR